MNKNKYNQKYVVDLLTKLISYESTTDNQVEVEKCLNFIASEIASVDYDVKIIKNKATSSLYATSKNSNVKMLLFGHIDVVPASQSQFQTNIVGDKIYGRGTLDMKGAVAVMIHLLQTTSGFDLLLTGDEEIGGPDGADNIIKNKLIKPYDLVITGEPTDLVVATEEKGVIWLDAIFSGKSAHAAKPWEGVNPLFKLNKILSFLKNEYGYSKPVWKTTVTPTLVKTTNGQNQVAEKIKLGIDCRYIPTDDPQVIIQKLRSYCDDLEILHLDGPLKSIPSALVDQLVEYSGKPTGSMHWATDARYFEDTPAVIYGPSGEGMHSASEYVNISSLAIIYQTLSQLVGNLR